MVGHFPKFIPSEKKKKKPATTAPESDRSDFSGVKSAGVTLRFTTEVSLFFGRAQKHATPTLGVDGYL